MSAGLALVTGASSGIGEAIARQLAQAGHPLVLVARRRDRLEALAAALRQAHGVAVTVIPADLAAPGAAQGLLDTVQAQGLSVRILVNNAGYGMQGRFLDMSLDELDAMFQLNVTALVHLTALFGRQMVASGGGHILQVASSVALVPSPWVSAYAGSKAAVGAFSEAVAYELRGEGVWVTTLYPGITTTEFNAVAGAKTPAVMRGSVLSADAVARIGLQAMFRRRRAVVPGLINRVNALLSRVLPRGLVIGLAGWLMGRANAHR